MFNRKIKDESDLELWHKSVAFFKLQNFLEKLFEAVKGLKISQIPNVPENISTSTISNIPKLLQKVTSAVEETEPIKMTGQRYGNKSFRILMERIRRIAAENLTDEFLREMFVASFGNESRIDYGTGHELSFIIFVMCSYEKDESFVENVDVDVDNVYGWIGGRLIGMEYLELVRRIQERYSLEPAGSHGVWGLDDYQFIPFLLGSSQLIGSEEIDEGILAPASLIQPKIFSNEQLRREYLYPTALYHIHRLKTRSNPSLQFHNHSRILYDISGIPHWQRIHDGLKRMYLKEVLSKFPVVQHLQFDEILFKFEERK